MKRAREVLHEELREEIAASKGKRAAPSLRKTRKRSVDDDDDASEWEQPPPRKYPTPQKDPPPRVRTRSGTPAPTATRKSTTRQSTALKSTPRKSTPRKSTARGLVEPNSDSDEESRQREEDDEVADIDGGGGEGGTGGRGEGGRGTAATAVGGRGRIHPSHAKGTARRPPKLPTVPLLREEEVSYWKSNLPNAEYSFILTRGTFVMKQSREGCS